MNERNCKKCGRPLAIDSKYNKCENCRTKSAHRLKRVGKTAAMTLVAVGGTVLTIATKGKIQLPKK